MKPLCDFIGCLGDGDKGAWMLLMGAAFVFFSIGCFAAAKKGWM